MNFKLATSGTQWKQWATELFETSVALEVVQLGCLFHTKQEADHW